MVITPLLPQPVLAKLSGALDNTHFFELFVQVFNQYLLLIFLVLYKYIVRICMYL